MDVTVIAVRLDVKFVIPNYRRGEWECGIGQQVRSKHKHRHEKSRRTYVTYGSRHHMSSIFDIRVE